MSQDQQALLSRLTQLSTSLANMAVSIGKLAESNHALAEAVLATVLEDQPEEGQGSLDDHEGMLS